MILKNSSRSTKIAIMAGFFSVILFACSAIAQGLLPGVDPAMAKQLGEAAQSSNAIGYVLGLITLGSLSFSAWNINRTDKKDAEATKAIVELTYAIKEQTTLAAQNSSINKDSLKSIDESLKEMNVENSKRICAMNPNMMKDVVQGIMVEAKRSHAGG